MQCWLFEERLDNGPRLFERLSSLCEIFHKQTDTQLGGVIFELQDIEKLCFFHTKID